MYRWFRKFYKISNESTLLPCIPHRSRLFWLNSLDIMEFLSWKRFILMWSILQSVFQRKRVLRSSWLLNEHNLSCKIVKKRILSAVCKLTIKTPPHSAVYIRMWCIKIIKGWLTRRQIQLLLARFCKVKLSNTKNSAWLFHFGLPFRQRNATYKLQKCKLANLLWSRAFVALDSSKMMNAIFWVYI